MQIKRKVEYKFPILLLITCIIQKPILLPISLSLLLDSFQLLKLDQIKQLVNQLEVGNNFWAVSSFWLVNTQ